MRNRAVELFLLPVEQRLSFDTPTFTLESSVYRFRNFMNILNVEDSNLLNTSFADVLADHLSVDDSALIASFPNQVSAGLLSHRPRLALLSHDSLNMTWGVDSFVYQNMFNSNKGPVNSTGLPSWICKVQVSVPARPKEIGITDQEMYIVNPSSEQHHSCQILTVFILARSLECFDVRIHDPLVQDEPEGKFAPEGTQDWSKNYSRSLHARGAVHKYRDKSNEKSCGFPHRESEKHGRMD
jgi:hypothetical protein